MRSRSSLTQDEHGLFTLSKWRSFIAPRIWQGHPFGRRATAVGKLPTIDLSWENNFSISLRRVELPKRVVNRKPGGKSKRISIEMMTGSDVNIVQLAGDHC
jgi:hypothetical protein